MKLVELLEKFNLNADFLNNGYAVGGTDKNSCHSYIENFYEDAFEKYKKRKVSILEVGIETGGSLKLWKEYFTNAKSIVGVDISDDKLHPDYKDMDGVDIHICNGYDEVTSENFGKFDIIIDDGPHTLESQLKFIELYLKKLKKGGLFIIEDIQNVGHFDSLIDKAKEVAEGIDNDYEYEVECIDLREKKGRWDDLIFVVRS